MKRSNTPWTCNICTLDNDPTSYLCDACSNERGLTPCTDSLEFHLLRSSTSPFSNIGAAEIQDIIPVDTIRLLIFTFLVDLNYFAKALPALHCTRIDLIHGHKEDPDLEYNGRLLGMTCHNVKSLGHWGTHHTKMFMCDRGTTLRIVVLTANLLPPDWSLITQGVWMQDFPRSTTSSTTEMRLDLSRYLLAYDKPANDPPLRECVREWAEGLRDWDFSAATVSLVASVPGTFSMVRGQPGQCVDGELWGLGRVRRLQRKEAARVAAAIAKGNRLAEKSQPVGPIYAQFTSMGVYDESWMEFASDAFGGPIHGIWVSVDTVQHSLLGWTSGNSIPGAQKNVKKFPRDLLHRWDGSIWGRQQVTPHIKTFTRMASGGGLSWVIMGSHNFSRSAWGKLQADSLEIASFEMSVMWHPSRHQWREFTAATPSDVATLVESPAVADKTGRLLFPIPHSLPPPPFTENEVPWAWDVAWDGLDRHEARREAM